MMHAKRTWWIHGIYYNSHKMLLFLTKSCSRPPIVWFDVAIDIIPLVLCIDKGTVLSSSSIVWLPRIPVGENDTFASWFENPLTLSVTVVDAQPEVNFPRIKVLPLHLGIDGSVLLQRVDLNEVSWDFLLFFAELLGFTLCHWGFMEPVAACWELCPRSRTTILRCWTIWKSCCESRKGNDKDEAEVSFHHFPLNCFLLRGDLLLAATELGLSGYCEQAPFKPNVPDSRGVKRSAQWLVAVKRGISLPPSARTRPSFWFSH